jgi:hypothetical protein
MPRTPRAWVPERWRRERLGRAALAAWQVGGAEAMRCGPGLDARSWTIFHPCSPSRGVSAVKGNYSWGRDVGKRQVEAVVHPCRRQWAEPPRPSAPPGPTPELRGASAQLAAGLRAAAEAAVGDFRGALSFFVRYLSAAALTVGPVQQHPAGGSGQADEGLWLLTLAAYRLLQGRWARDSWRLP